MHADPSKKQFIIKTLGDEYQRLNEIKATNAQLIIPLNFPATYDVEDPYDARLVSLEEMKHWEMAPANLAAIEKTPNKRTSYLSHKHQYKNTMGNH